MRYFEVMRKRKEKNYKTLQEMGDFFAKRILGLLVIFSLFINLLFPLVIVHSPDGFVLRSYNDLYPSSAAKYSVSKVIYVTSTGYSSTVDQCDSDPCTTASGLNVCQRNIEDVIAANFLPFGTKVRFPNLFGDRIFTVHDRMNARFTNRVDFWFKSRDKAVFFGKRTVAMEILKQEK